MRSILLILFSIITLSLYSQSKKIEMELSFALKEYRLKKNNLIVQPPLVDSVDFYRINVDGYLIEFVNNDSLANGRRIYVNHKIVKLLSFENIEEEIRVDEDAFPNYSLSYFVYDRKKKYFKVISILPGCVGISCSFRVVQIIDLKGNVCYEKILKAK